MWYLLSDFGYITYFIIFLNDIKEGALQSQQPIDQPASTYDTKYEETQYLKCIGLFFC